jgi:hypothetical protein
MLRREIQLDPQGDPVTLNPRWLRIPAAVKYSGLSRSKLYELLGLGLQPLRATIRFSTMIRPLILDI